MSSDPIGHNAGEFRALGNADRQRPHLEIADLVPSIATAVRWSLPPLDPGIRPQSLTNLLPTIPAVESALLPHSRRAIAAINRALAGRPYLAPSESTRRTRSYSRVALAVDRAALFLGGHDVATAPMEWLLTGGGAQRRMGELLAAWSPSPRSLFHNRAGVGWLYALGGLDVARRGFIPLSDVITSPIPRRIDADRARRWCESLIPEDMSDEIVRLLRSLKDIRIRGAISPNPIFGGIGPISGSDGDWVVADTLVELKCVVDGVKRRHVAQLVCYHALGQLADQRENLPSFSRLALCLPRQSATITGTVNEWLYAFGAPRSEIVVDALHRCFDPRRFTDKLAGASP